MRECAMVGKAARAGAGAAACLVGLAAVWLARPASTPRIRRRGTASSSVLAALENIRIGDSDQWLLERSENVANPILLYVHGGPGTSQLTSNRRDTRRLERFFTVVNWDQRGAGKSYAAIRDARQMTIDQFVADTRDVTSHLLAKFGQNRLVLVGHSWGTVIGTLAVSRYPALYSCYVGIGQVGNMADGETASYQWTLEQAQERGHRRAAGALAAMGPPPYSGDWQKKTIMQRMYLARLGGEIYGNRHGASGLVLAGVLLSPEYTLTDRLNYFRGIFRLDAAALARTAHCRPLAACA
jgi:pimeloyl-ACP methyl ester carboxylesterase